MQRDVEVSIFKGRSHYGINDLCDDRFDVSQVLFT